jgi:Ca-activated chloride channel family protein
MEPRIATAERELRAALAGLQPQESFNIVAFYGRTRVHKRALVPATPQNVAQANRFLDGLRLDNGTNLERALVAALGMRDINVVVVITDGVPTYGETNFEKLARRVRVLNKTNARIYTVGLVGKNPDGTDDTFEATRLLKQIASENSGEFRVVSVEEAAPKN